MRFPFHKLYPIQTALASGLDPLGAVTEVPDIDPGMADKIINTGLRMGVDEIDCFIQWGKGIGVVIEGNELKRASGGSSSGFGVRVLKKKKIGFSYATSFEDITPAIENALKISQISPLRDHHFPEGGNYSTVPGLYDRKLEEMDVSELVKLMELMMEGVKEIASDGTISHGGGGFGTERCFIANSQGVEYQDEGTGISASVSCILDRAGVSTGSASGESTMHDLDVREIAREAAELAVRGIGSKPGPSGDLEVILTNEAAWELFENAVVPAFYGPEVKEGKTYIHNRIGERIAPDWLSLIDDPLMPGGLGSSPSDDEGVPSITVPLIENGHANGILFDNFSSQKYSETRTSSGVRAERMMGGRSFRSPPNTLARNLVVKGSLKKDRDSMMDEIDRGIIVYDILGAHTANRVSGDFSVNSSLLFYIEKGEVIHPISSAMLSGNALDILPRINCIGKDVKKMGGGMSAASASMPSMRIDGMRVTGS